MTLNGHKICINLYLIYIKAFCKYDKGMFHNSVTKTKSLESMMIHFRYQAINSAI